MQKLLNRIFTKILPEMSFSIEFRKSSARESASRNFFLKDFSTLQDGAFFPSSAIAEACALRVLFC